MQLAQVLLIFPPTVGLWIQILTRHRSTYQLHPWLSACPALPVHALCVDPAGNA